MSVKATHMFREGPYDKWQPTTQIGGQRLAAEGFEVTEFNIDIFSRNSKEDLSMAIATTEQEAKDHFLSKLGGRLVCKTRGRHTFCDTYYQAQEFFKQFEDDDEPATPVKMAFLVGVDLGEENSVGQLSGVYEVEDEAIAACETELHYVTTVKLNTPFSPETNSMCFFPKTGETRELVNMGKGQEELADASLAAEDGSDPKATAGVETVVEHHRETSKNTEADKVKVPNESEESQRDPSTPPPLQARKRT